jgi:hypothetical protein
MKTIEPAQAQNQRLFAFNDHAGEKENFQKNFDLLPFEFHHSLSTNPRFAMANVRALALRLPSTISFSGDTTVVKGWERPSTSIEQALDTLEAGGSWIILKKIQDDPEYGALLSQCLSELEELTHRQLGREIESRTMSLILSSPGQVTPYHIDADCNFLFQIHGTKAFYVFDGRDRSVLTEPEVESFWSGNINAAKYREENQPKAWTYQLRPGVGVHVPVVYPHWVKNSDAVSMSLSINFRFRRSSYADLCRANHFIRKLGMRPAPIGRSKTADSIKAGVFGGARKLSSKLKSMRGKKS